MFILCLLVYYEFYKTIPKGTVELEHDTLFAWLHILIVVSKSKPAGQPTTFKSGLTHFKLNFNKLKQTKY